MKQKLNINKHKTKLKRKKEQTVKHDRNIIQNKTKTTNKTYNREQTAKHNRNIQKHKCISSVFYIKAATETGIVDGTLDEKIT